MSTSYHKQPHTLDANIEIPEDAPLAMGHDEEDREDVREQRDEFADQVKAEREAREEAQEAGEPEPGAPRAAGDHAGSEADPKASEGDCPPQGSVDDVKVWVGDDRERAAQALDAERAGQGRVTLIAWLEDMTA
jgi:hypothetical protein